MGYLWTKVQRPSRMLYQEEIDLSVRRRLPRAAAVWAANVTLCSLLLAVLGCTYLEHGSQPVLEALDKVGKLHTTHQEEVSQELKKAIKDTTQIEGATPG